MVVKWVSCLLSLPNSWVGVELLKPHYPQGCCCRQLVESGGQRELKGLRGKRDGVRRREKGRYAEVKLAGCGVGSANSAGGGVGRIWWPRCGVTEGGAR